MSLTRPVFKSNVRGRGSGQTPIARGQVHGNMSSVDRQDSHTRNHESYYGSSSSSGHVGTPQQHGSYAYDSQNMNWRAHNGPRNFPPPRMSQTPPTPESPSQPSLMEDETVRFLADAWAEVEREYTNPRDEASKPVLFEDKTYRNRNEHEVFELDSWHTRRLSRH